ncbi:MAG: GNAT family N-acetyltransferase [Clostridiales bacterium]|nr:GNAT family N-acetyltransferase [Clostridiales bacterium]
MVEVREVSTRKEQKIFAKFPYELYQKVPQAIPDLIQDELDNFNSNKNPAYQYCSVKQFLAFQDGKCVGRIAGIINHAANEKWNTKRIRFSRVDFIDDYEVSAALFHAVEEYGRSEGMMNIHGPIGFCDMDQQGMLVEGFEEEGMFLTIYNFPYYIKHLEKLGYMKDVDWIEYQIGMPKEENVKLKKISNAVMKRYHITLIEPKSRKEISPYITPVLNLINIAYRNLYGTVELSKAQIEKYYKQFKLLINPNYVKLLLDENKKLVGFGLAMPSLNQAIRKSRARLLPFGWYRILRAPYAKTKVLDLYLIGILPEMQNKGLTAVLLSSMTETAAKNGIEYAETGPELETNHQVQALWKHYDVRQHKRRRCWIKNL